jgi:hypothetical protein
MRGGVKLALPTASGAEPEHTPDKAGGYLGFVKINLRIGHDCVMPASGSASASAGAGPPGSSSSKTTSPPSTPTTTSALKQAELVETLMVEVSSLRQRLATLEARPAATLSNPVVQYPPAGASSSPPPLLCSSLRHAGELSSSSRLSARQHVPSCPSSPPTPSSRSRAACVTSSRTSRRLPAPSHSPGRFCRLTPGRADWRKL